jgi:hypothetical protein
MNSEQIQSRSAFFLLAGFVGGVIAAVLLARQATAFDPSAMTVAFAWALAALSGMTVQAGLIGYVLAAR